MRCLERNLQASISSISLSKKKTKYSLLYVIFNLLAITLIGFRFWRHFGSENFSLTDGFSYLSFGVIFAFGLIPIHEYIHVLAYKSQGAVRTSYDANLRKFYFMAIADKFVANKKEFQIVALAPFVIISTVLLAVLFLTGQLWSYTILGILFTHTAFCSGDFGLLSYFDFHKDKNIVTFDDKENGITYFYGQPK